MSVIVAVRDLKASAFVHPHLQVSDGVAVRAFSDAVLDKNSAVSAHPQDYQLFCLLYLATISLLPLNMTLNA